jgi:TolB-like protein/Flp pilus assembly protein TadD
MSRSGHSALWEPEILSPEQEVQVCQHLEQILGSHAFAGSKRTQEFLRLIVRHALHGEIESLRERMIGAELFGRPIGYDTGNDSVVRVRANEVRKKLALYYSDLKEEKPALCIELPSGSYVPRFHFEQPGGTDSATADAPEAAASEVVARPARQEHVPAQDVAAAGTTLRARFMRNKWYIVAGIPLASILIALLLFVNFRKKPGGASASHGIHSIAILPLENLSGIPEQDYFADGMTEELINDLGQVSTLRVISLTSSMSYKGTKKNLPQIAHELSVDGVVEGGVVRDGNQVRVSVQLIDASTDRPIWAHTYARDLNSELPWQGEVAQAIAEEISTEVTPQEQARLVRKRSVIPEAQDLYLHGIRLREADDCKDAVDLFNRAIEKDPGYAEAHSALASCYGMLGESGRMPYEAAFSQQKAEAIKAIELDDSLSEAHAELANTAMTLDWDWQAASAEFRRALELNPSSAPSHEKYAFYLVRTGHPREAISEIERSVDLDPVSGSTFHAQGFIYYFSRQYEQALAVTRTVQGLKIDLSDWSFLLGDIYAEKGMYQQSIAAFLKSGDGPYSLGHLGNAYARAGEAAAARKCISELQKRVKSAGVGRYEIALIYAGLGDKDSAFTWLEDAYHAHDVGLVYLKVDPCLDPLRSDPRFDDLLRRVGLAQ